jgi:hypothetical protein
MSYLISVFFNNTNIAALIGSLIYVIAFFPFIVMVTIEDELSYVVKVFMVSQLLKWSVCEMNGSFCPFFLDSQTESSLM